MNQTATATATATATHQRISGTLRLNKSRLSASAGDAGGAGDAGDAAASGVTKDSAIAGKHVDLTHPSRADEPALPHERDEQVGMTGGVASPMVEQAARDLKRGIKDTSRAVESNVAYEKLKATS